MPGEPDEYWGTVLPDRLGEFLAIRLLGRGGDRIDPGGSAAAEMRACSNFWRVALMPGSHADSVDSEPGAEHDRSAAAWIEGLVRVNPSLLGAAALQVAAYAENPAPLRSALVQLGIRTL